MPTTRTQAAAQTGRATTLAYAYLEALAKATEDPTMGLQQLRLLIALGVHSTLNQADLEAHTGVKKSSNGRNIDRLGSGSFREPGLGFLESYEDERDRRYKLVRLTPKGRAVLEQAALGIAAYLKD